MCPIDGWYIRYYIFMSEYMWSHIDTREEGKVVTVMDVKGVGIKDLYGEVLEFLRMASDLMQVSQSIDRTVRIVCCTHPSIYVNPRPS